MMVTTIAAIQHCGSSWRTHVDANDDTSGGADRGKGDDCERTPAMVFLHDMSNDDRAIGMLSKFCG
jgi:hypothetical protein